jgi:hypothetical protein
MEIRDWRLEIGKRKEEGGAEREGPRWLRVSVNNCITAVRRDCQSCVRGGLDDRKWCSTGSSKLAVFITGFVGLDVLSESERR